jgi:imidazole glycerol-phosphate synthase subunit HisH
MAGATQRMIGIIDYGLGNLFSLEKALKRASLPYLVSANTGELAHCSRYILSGVGHFKYGMEQLTSRGLVPFLSDAVIINRKPLLGICLGMQILREFSEEGNTQGLGYISGRITRLSVPEPLKIPHIGWNEIQPARDCRLLHGLDLSEKFYFTHSYGSRELQNDAVAGITDYGGPFVSVIEKNNIFGVQCHPEKSFGQGIKLLKNFATV